MKKLRYFLFFVLACITVQSNACELGVLAHIAVTSSYPTITEDEMVVVAVAALDSNGNPIPGIELSLQYTGATDAISLLSVHGVTDQDGIAKFKILGKKKGESETVKITAIPINIDEWIIRYGDKDSDPRIGSITLNIV